MQTPAPHKFYGLDHLRALAILFVFFYHYQILFPEPNWLIDVAAFGWTGVDLFFVLSGFLISSQLFLQIKNGQTVSFKTFFIKRFFRILPAYWVVLAIYFLVPQFHEREALSPLWKFLTFTQNLGLDLTKHRTFSHAWSLCVEEHFYLFLPILLIALQRTKLFKKAYVILIVLFLAGLATRIYSFDHLYLPRLEEPRSWALWYKFIYYPTYNRLDGLLVGVSIAAMYHFLPTLWSVISRYGNYIFIVGLLILTGAYFLCEDPHTYAASVWGFPLVALGYGCFVIAAVSPSSFLYRWNSRVTTFIATLSYAIYLSHKGMAHVTNMLWEKYELDANLVLIICLLTSILAAWILHLIVEKPFMKLRHKILREK